jgi:hypothetical protein
MNNLNDLSPEQPYEELIETQKILTVFMKIKREIFNTEILLTNLGPIGTNKVKKRLYVAYIIYIDRKIEKARKFQERNGLPLDLYEAQFPIPA